MEEYYGIVKEKRTFKWGGFFVFQDFGLGQSKKSRIQCVVKNDETNIDLDSIQSGSYVRITGETKQAKVKQELLEHESEIIASKIEVLTEPDSQLEANIFEKEVAAEQKYILDNRAVTLRNITFQTIFSIQDEILSLFRKYLYDASFTSISTPKIVAGVAEGGANMFELDYFGKPAFLAQSPQLYKQIMCGVFGRVYETAPVFRAEEHATSRHVNEYTSLDVETVLKKDFYELIELQKEILSYIIIMINRTQREKLEFLGVEPISIESLNNSIVLKVSEIKEILGTTGTDLTGEEEVEIAKYVKENHDTDFVYVTHYSKEKRPFYTMLSEDGLTTESYDLIFRGVEITSGGQRKHNYQDYVNTMEEAGMSIESFSSYLQAFKHGMPYHGGFAIGLERLTAKICGVESAKMCALFPRDVNRLTP
jgi:nondiscriminating aspartyl-tRNA synthetase